MGGDTRRWRNAIWGAQHLWYHRCWGWEGTRGAAGVRHWGRQHRWYQRCWEGGGAGEPTPLAPHGLRGEERGERMDLLGQPPGQPTYCMTYRFIYLFIVNAKIKIACLIWWKQSTYAPCMSPNESTCNL